MLALLGTLLVSAAPRALDNAPGGYRLSPALPSSSVAIRPALVVDPEWARVAQFTFDGRLYREPWSYHLQHPIVFAWRSDGSWSSAGLGLVRLGAARAISKKPRWIGAELFLPITPPGMTAQSWGSVAQETLFGAGGRLSYERLWDLRSPISLRMALGAHYWSEPVLGSYAWALPSVLPSAEIIATRSWMNKPGWAVVTEGELTIDAIPASLRVMGRRTQPLERGSLVADLGVQIPPLTWVDWFSPQFVAQIRWYPEGIDLEHPQPPEEDEEGDVPGGPVGAR